MRNSMSNDSKADLILIGIMAITTLFILFLAQFS